LIESKSNLYFVEVSRLFSIILSNFSICAQSSAALARLPDS
jgi:hypothetical protein